MLLPPPLPARRPESEASCTPPVDPRGSGVRYPRRSVGRALWQTTLVNVVYELGNLVRGQVTARLTPETWWMNMQQRWVCDLDDFTVNQIGLSVELS